MTSGRYERPLDNNELLLKKVADPFKPLEREQWAVNIIARVHFGNQAEEETVAALRRAWIQTRYYHPLIAALLEGNSHVYQVPDEAALASWVLESFFVHKDKTVEDFLKDAGLLTYSSFHFFPACSEVVMRTHHWLIDGIGSLHLMDQFLTLFSADGNPPSFGDEWKSLAPSHSEIVGLASKLAPPAEEEAQKLFMSFVANLPSIGLPTESALAPGGTCRSTLAFPRATLRALVAASKRRSVSIGAAVNAAITVATQENATPSPLAKNFTSVVFFNHRPYMPAPYNDASAWPMGVWMIGMPFSLPPADFATQAKALQKVYKQPMVRTENPALDLYDSYCEKMASALSQPPPPGIPAPSQPQLSSLGVVDGRIQGTYAGKRQASVLHVEPVLDMMTTPLMMFQWSFGGMFMINACYNECFYQSSYVDKFLARVKEILFQGMGVNVDA